MLIPVGQNDGCDECDPNADCINTECECRDGYFGNGRTCSGLCDIVKLI